MIAALGAGGAERVIAWLIRQLADHGASITIVSFDSPADPIYHDFGTEAALIRLDISAGRLAGNPVPAPVRRVLALRRVLRELSPDVAIGFLTKINAILLAATIGLDVPVIVSERNNPEAQPAHAAWKHSLRLLYRRASAIICQTEASTRCIPQACRQRVSVIPNPVIAPRLAGATGRQERHRIAGVGRLERQKGFDILIEAFALVAADQPSWDLDIWGQGPDLEGLRTLADTLRLSDRVTFRGLSERPGGWIGETDLFVLASRFEGFPNVLGEAMAAGLPVISTNCDFGPAELIDDDRSGLLVAPDDPHAMAAALDRLMGDEPLRMRMGAAATEVTRRFSSPAVAGMWRQALTEAIRYRAASSLS